jgi:hypothetical protein
MFAQSSPEANQALDERVSIVPELRKTEIEKYLPTELNNPESQWQALQRKYIKQWLIAALVASDWATCKGSILRLGREVRAAGHTEFDFTVSDELGQVVTLVEPPAVSLKDKVAAPLSYCLQSSKDESKLAVVFGQFPQHGRAFIANAEARVVEALALEQWAGKIDTTVGDLQNLCASGDTTGTDMTKHFCAHIEQYSSATSTWKALYLEESPTQHHAFEDAVLKLGRRVTKHACLVLADLLTDLQTNVETKPSAAVSFLFLDLAKVVEPFHTDSWKSMQSTWMNLVGWSNIISSSVLAQAITKNLKDVGRAKEIMNMCDTLDNDFKLWLDGDQTLGVSLAHSRQWLVNSVASPMSQLIQHEVEMPMATLFGIFGEAEALEKAFADGNPDDFHNNGAACTAMLKAEASINEAAKKVEAVTAGVVAVQRMQFVLRYIYLVMSLAAVCLLNAKENISDPIMQAVIKFNVQIVSFESWAKAAATQFPVLTADWDLRADVEAIAKRCLDLCVKLQDRLLNNMNEHMKQVAKELKEMSPSKVLVETPKMFVDISLQASLQEQAAKLLKSKLLVQAGDILAVLTKYNHESATKQLQGGRAVLSTGRRFSKIAIAVAWAVSEITTFMSGSVNSPAEIISHAEGTKEKLRNKGFGSHKAS